MPLRINTNHPKTIKFLEYIVKKIIKGQSSEQYKITKFRIQQDRTPFPVFEKYIPSLDGDFATLEPIFKPGKGYDEKAVLIGGYLNQKFNENATTSMPKRENNKSLTFTFEVVSGNPYGMLNLAHELGINTNFTKTKLANKNRGGKKNSKTILYLSKSGELWRNPRKKYCYVMEEKSDRHKIIRYFAENKLYDYCPTQELANVLKEGNIETFTKEIGNINDNALGKIKLKNRILEGKEDSGYRISPKYLIMPSKK